jgi:hypothetical protein
MEKINMYHSHSNGVGKLLLGFVGGAIVWALFGDKIKQKANENQTFQDMKSQVMDKVERYKDLTQTKYNQVVDEISETYAKAKGISNHELRDLASDLKLHWAKIKHRWNEPPNAGMQSSTERDEFPDSRLTNY